MCPALNGVLGCSFTDVSPGQRWPDLQAQVPSCLDTDQWNPVKGRGHDCPEALPVDILPRHRSRGDCALCQDLTWCFWVRYLQGKPWGAPPSFFTLAGIIYTWQGWKVENPSTASTLNGIEWPFKELILTSQCPLPQIGTVLLTTFKGPIVP